MRGEVHIDREELRELVREVLAEELKADPEGWLSYAQAAELTGLSEWTIGEAVRRGELEADYPLPRCPRVRRSKLARWMGRGNREGGSANVPVSRRA